MKTSIRSILVACLLGIAGSVHAQEGLVAPIAGWTNYVSHKATVEITQRGNLIYAVTEGGLFTYDVFNADKQQFTTIQGLSSVDPTTVYADKASGIVFVGFRDGMVNYLDADNNIRYITDIERSDLFTTKNVNRFVAEDGLLYIATAFGIVVYDINLDETRLSITKISDNATGTAVNDVAISRGRLWAAMGSAGLWSVDLNEPNITLPGVWQKESGANGMPVGSSRYICNTGDILYTLVGDTVLKRNPGQNWVKSPFALRPWVYLNAANDRVYASHGPVTGILYPDSNYVQINSEGSTNCSYAIGGTVYVGDQNVGLLRWENNNFIKVSPDGPRNNFVTALAAGNGEMYIAPAGKRGSSDRLYDKSGIPYYNFLDGGWTISDHRNGALAVGEVYQDFARTFYDKLTGRCYMGSWAEGIVVMEKGVPIETITPANSGMSTSAGLAKISGMATDEFGNLWMTQMVADGADVPINVRTTDGQWHHIRPNTSISAIGLIVDDFNNKWIINQGNGVTVYNDNYTIDNPSDDRVMNLTTAFGSGGLPDNSVHAIAQDLDQQIWIGTTDGVTILYDPSVIWTSDFQDAACPIIDGFCLLRDQRVNGIAVDGANRKWIATEFGVFHVNEDGTELLQHFTEDNSPLYDNDVKAVAIDHTTGEVFFGTAKGVISYMGDAIDGREDAEELYVFPNPVFEDHEGVIMIKGMRSKSKVKIATVSGRLVRELDSQGGETPWDMRDTYGNKVTPGIYLVFVGDKDGEGAGIIKMAIIERQN